MANNPRIDDLRKRLEKEPGSRLFAQLAEELRKDGEFEEAIRIARAGLARHPSYPSARMTLGRALFDTGDMAAARHELQSVLDGAPDNILASRLLAECLEGLGDLEGALKHYRATLALSPGDKQIAARVQDLEGRVHAAPAATAASAAPAAVQDASPAPIPLATVEEPMELEVSHERPAPPAESAVRADSSPEFELEKAYEAPGTEWRRSEPRPESLGERTLVDEPVAERPAAVEVEPLRTVEAAPGPSPPPPAEEPAAPAAQSAFEYTFEPVMPAAAAPPPVVEAQAPPAVQDWTPAPLPAPAPPPPEPAAPSASAAAAPPTEEADLVSPTLAELYLNQGFRDKAIEVYRRLLEREPGNDRARARLSDLEGAAASAAPAASSPSSPAPADLEAARAARRQALERTIDRLESLRAALQRGSR